MAPPYPFSAVVGLADLRLSLLLNAVSPTIGGVLVRGEKGTAKSTVVRALAGLLPALEVVAGCRFSCDPAAPDAGCPDAHRHEGVERRPARLVELPVGATEDRLVGALDLEHALTSGHAHYEPGLLAAAHRGVLYVDEVNLLPDHLVDLLLDAAAMGEAHVERDGVSVRHTARFLLVGTMNPEEGELRPQLLDRFGLAVDVRAPREASERVEVVRRRLAYEADPVGFAAQWADSDASLKGQIEAARDRLSKVDLPDAELMRIAHVCAAFEVDGMRADIVVARAAMALAAWHDRFTVTAEDVRFAARLALPHRRRRNPFDAPGLDEQALDDALNEDPEPEPDPDPPPGSAQPRPGDGKAPRSETRTDAPQNPERAKLFAVPGTGHGAAGRRSQAQTRTGRTVGARPGAASLHLVATLRAAARYQKNRGRIDHGPVRLRKDDLRERVRQGQESNLVLFCVDASGSMAARQRMSAVKTAVLSLLLDAYQRRDKVGLVTFRADGAQLVLPPTSSVEAGAARLRELPTGGRTPLAVGLMKAAETLRLQRLRDPHRRALLVVVTDGRATAGGDPGAAASVLARMGVASVVVDCEAGHVRLGLAEALAVQLGAEHVRLAAVTASDLRAAAGRRAA
ncbi:magnesium chelatase subunit D family protein [Allorhizocola rhizosphaerae]|uniref:magnesium chelatase subunit D family protein n=1 Tax=Allorhizocola rhizosphaerae TaxID=1872709 RepID=UPI000E3D9E31|nr:magnesium chelatase subunit D family protein [Allorhizocola rhizosphaerae]